MQEVSVLNERSTQPSIECFRSISEVAGDNSLIPRQLMRFFVTSFNSDKNAYFQEYDIEMHQDVHSAGHTQWFYFSCSNMIAGREVKFNIQNFHKSNSLFNYGMRPLVFSNKRATKGVGWRRTGRDISYFASKKKKKKSQHYTLTFTHLFEDTGDKCFFACSFPYTYTDMQHFLHQLQMDQTRNITFRRTSLCKTLAGNHCDLLTITEQTGSLEELQKRSGVILTSRVHPGETNASWIMQGIIDFLTGASPEARALRSRYIFKVCPMMNPDGVINGNYRTSMAGVDLNRRWNRPHECYHPTIFETKELVRHFQKCRKIVTVCDIHGHSRKEGCFMYGCIPEFNCRNKNDTFITPHYFPQIFDKKSDFFQLKGCNFKMQRSKASTMRMVMYHEFGVHCTYTMEASLSGANGYHFSCKDLERMGHEYCLSLLEFSMIESPHPEKPICHSSLNANSASGYFEDFATAAERGLTVGPEMQWADSGGSDSCPSEDNLSEKEILTLLRSCLGEARTKKGKKTTERRKKGRRKKKSISRKIIKLDAPRPAPIVVQSHVAQQPTPQTNIHTMTFVTFPPIVNDLPSHKSFLKKKYRTSLSHNS